MVEKVYDSIREVLTISGLVPASGLHMVVEYLHKHGFCVASAEENPRLGKGKEELRGPVDLIYPF